MKFDDVSDGDINLDLFSCFSLSFFLSSNTLSLLPRHKGKKQKKPLSYRAISLSYTHTHKTHCVKKNKNTRKNKEKNRLAVN